VKRVYSRRVRPTYLFRVVCGEHDRSVCRRFVIIYYLLKQSVYELMLNIEFGTSINAVTLPFYRPCTSTLGRRRDIAMTIPSFRVSLSVCPGDSSVMSKWLNIPFRFAYGTDRCYEMETGHL